MDMDDNTLCQIVVLRLEIYRVGACCWVCNVLERYRCIHRTAVGFV